MQKLLVGILLVPAASTQRLKQWDARPQYLLAGMLLLAAAAWGAHSLHSAGKNRWLRPLTHEPPPPGASVLSRKLLEEVVTQFYVKHGRLPAKWTEIEAQALIQGMPAPPDGTAYRLDVTQMELTIQPVAKPD